MHTPYRLRRAAASDAPALRRLHQAAFAELASDHYTPRQVDGFLADVETVDADLIADGTYYVVEHEGRVVASGGWTLRRPSYATAEDEASPPGAPTARRATIRAVFTDPAHARRGLARRIMDFSEEQAVVHGMADRLELCATLSGLPLYLRLGYTPSHATTARLTNGETFSWINMSKSAWPPLRAPSFAPAGSVSGVIPAVLPPAAERGAA